jgi:hypothetical protein
MPSWDITVYARFHPGLQLYSGKLVRHLDDESGRLLIPPVELPYEMTIPADAREVELWFQNIDGGGCKAWDSRSGENYWFQIAPGSTTIPQQSVAIRSNVVQSRDVVNVVGEGAVKSNAFPGRAGQGTRLETRLVVVAWVRNLTFAKSVWMDVHVFDAADKLIESQSAPLEYQGPGDGGGDLFELDRMIYLGSVATPGSVSPRPEARKVQYRLYCEMNDKTYTDGVLHQHELSEDVVH